MRPLVLAPILCLAIPATAQSPKEGEYETAWSATGTAHVLPMGDKRAAQANRGLLVFPERADGGFKSGMTGECLGLSFTDGATRKYEGYCSFVDASGDRLHEWFEEVRRLADGTIEGRGTGLGGTGRYEGATHSYTYTSRAARPFPAGTFRVSGTQKGTFRLGK